MPREVPLDVLKPPLAAAPPGHRHRPRIRLTAIAGALAAAGVVLGFFLPWATVRADVAREYRERVRARLGEASQPPATAEDWRRLADLLATRGAVAGPDVFHWARTARGEAALRREARRAAAVSPDAEPHAENPYFERATLLLLVLLGSLPVAGAFLFLYFLFHQLRRAKTPALVLAMLLGLLAVAFPATYRIAEGVLGEETDPAPGFAVLLAAGFTLFLTGAFGVKTENWWKTVLGFLVVGGGLGLLGYWYVRGAIPT